MNDNNESVEIYEEQLPEFQTIGKFLCSEREKQNLTLREISKNTKIGTTMLELLEQDEFDQLPNRAYVVGYVKSYAKEVSVDTNMALNVLEETYSLFEGAIKRPARKITSTTRTKTSVPPIKIPLPKMITGLGVIALLGMSYVYFVNGTTNINALNAAHEEVTPTTVSETTPLQKEQHQDIKVVEGENEVKAVTPPTNKKIILKEEIKTKKIKLRKISGVLYSSTETTATDLKKIPSGIRGKYIAGQQNLVVISKNETTWMTYKKDNDEIKQFKLRKNARLLISGNVIRLYFGNINATEIFLNDKKLLTPSKTGVKSLVVPQVSRFDYKLPLFIYKRSGKVITSEDYEKEAN